MNHDKHALSRLFKAAKHSQRGTPDSMPFALESRILARWRSAMPEDESLLLATLFRRAVAFATLIMVVSIGWSRMGDASEVVGADALASLEKAIQVVP
jgi:hypothetical protein